MRVEVGKKKITVQRSEPHLVWNGKELSWHFSKDLPRDSYTSQKDTYAAPLILEKLRKLAGDDEDRFRLLTLVMTQTPWNDMYDTVLAHINRKFDVTMMNGKGESRENLIESPRYRAYRLNVERAENRCIVTAIIAGNFTGCAVASSLEMVEGFPLNEVGWYRCLISYDLVKMSANAEIQFIAYPENWEIRAIS